MLRSRRLFFGLLFAPLSFACAMNEQPNRELTEMVRSGTYRISILGESNGGAKSLDLLGVHSLWWGTQDRVWSREKQRFEPVVESLFKQTGGLIRFGGGSNEISHQACSSPPSARPEVMPVTWSGAMICHFGFQEYADALSAVGAEKSWLIGNIAGIDYKLFSQIELVNEVSQAAAISRKMGFRLQRYWELGNELERGRYGWSPELIAQRSSLAASTILKHDPQAKVILPLIEFDAPGQPPRKVFNERLLRSMNVGVDGIALHLYYDGQPGGPVVPTQLKAIRETADLYRFTKGKDASIWITEHGRWPAGDTAGANWESNWYQTNDMGGVLGTADFLIGLSQMAEVSGAMLHGVRAGPWNVFDLADGEPELSGVGHLLALLADPRPSIRLGVESVSRNQSGYAGGYDIRASAFLSTSRKQAVVWVVNRAEQATLVPIEWPPTLRITGYVSGRSLVCPVPAGRCSGRQFRNVNLPADHITPLPVGHEVLLPARSVTSLVFEL